MRNLREHAAAVPEGRVCARGAAMVEVDQDLQTLLENRMRLAIVEVGDEADAAGIVLLRGVVKSNSARQGGVCAEPSGLSVWFISPLPGLRTRGRALVSNFLLGLFEF